MEESRGPARLVGMPAEFDDRLRDRIAKGDFSGLKSLELSREDEEFHDVVANPVTPITHPSKLLTSIVGEVEAHAA